MFAKHLSLSALSSSLALSLGGLVLLSACSGTPGSTDTLAVDVPTAGSSEGLVPIATFLRCLPDSAALVAAHRGTGENLGAPENSISGLEALIAQGILMAEVDIAKIKDGTLISYHDGVWEMKSSGRGPVVATTPAEFAPIRLRDYEDGPVSGEAVPTLAQMLDTANDRIYLEVDFKTSADIGRVIDEIRARDMSDQVVLIATRDDEADILKAYADEFILSLPNSAAMDGQGIWVGGGWRNGPLRDIPKDGIVIGAQWNADGPSGAGPLDILVTDEISKFDPIVGLTDEAGFQACLSAG